jgi:3'-5' exoribonuclease
MDSPRHPPINSWKEGDLVAGFALLSRLERRNDRNGRIYLDLELRDATGRIDGKIWPDSPARSSVLEPHTFVAFEGTVQRFREQLQLHIKLCRPVNESDQAEGFSEEAYLPATSGDTEELWARLRAVLRDHVRRPVMGRLAQEALDCYGPQLKLHPAARSIHHAYQGGLLEHVTSMAELALLILGHYPQLDGDVLLLGVLFHDLGKLEELEPMPSAEYTPRGQMVGHEALGRDLLLERTRAIPEFPEDLRLHLEHLILSHAGKKEYGAVVEPMTAEALALHALDDLDSKLNQLQGLGQESQGFHYLRGLGRTVFLGSLDEDPEDRL